MKTCNRCNEEKTFEGFAINSKGKHGYKSICKVCSSSDQKALHKKRMLEDPKAEKHKRWAKHLRLAYGLSEEEYVSMLKKQNNRCAICLKSEGFTRDKLYVDHCHSSLENRGLLCQQCNTMIGMAQDKQEVLLNAIKYLQQHS